MRTADNSVCHHDGSSSGRVENASTSSATRASLRISAPSENQRLRSVASACSAVNNADRELCCRPIVRAIESDGSYGVAAKSSLSSFAQPLACALNHLFLPRVDNSLRLWEIGCRFFTGPERSRDCWLGRSRRSLSCLFAWRYRDFLLLLVPISGSPRIIPRRFPPSICSSCE